MNDKDKQEFEKWFKDYWEVDFNAGNPRFMGQSISWKYACEFKQKEIDILKNHDIAGYKEGIDCLQAEIKKLREALQWYADRKNCDNPDFAHIEIDEHGEEIADGGYRAREALKEVGENER
jgi:hypothetical protein